MDVKEISKDLVDAMEIKKKRKKYELDTIPIKKRQIPMISHHGAIPLKFRKTCQ